MQTISVAWIVKMAWRDARREFRKLLFCLLSISLGVAALVLVQALGHHMEVALQNESKALLGADLVIRGSAPFSERAEAFFDQLGGEQDRELRFNSMAFFPKQEATRLVLVRSLAGGFPFYGNWVVEPEFPSLAAAQEAAQSELPVAWLDAALFVQFDLAVGDTVRLGASTFTVAGQVKRVPGESTFSGTFAPRVYIAADQVPATGLLTFGSMVRFRAYFKLPEGVDRTALKPDLETLAAEEQLRYETVETQQERIGSVLDNVFQFLQITSFVALLLGAIGVSGAIQAYLHGKFEGVALLRCLGVGCRSAFAIYGCQVVAVAFIGVLLGVGLGTLLPSVLHGLLAPFLPFDLVAFVSWRSILMGLIFGFSTAMAFALLPLLPVRRVSALSALRERVEASYILWKDPLGLGLLGLIACMLLGFSGWQLQNGWHALIFCGSCAGVLLVLFGLAWLLRAGLRLVVGYFRLWEFNQGIKNLYRPNNRTLFVTMALGMGSFLVFTLYLMEQMLLNQANWAERSDEPDLLFFDVQWDQREGLYQLITDQGLAVVDAAPVVTMRLASVAGRSVASIRKDPDNTIEPWILNREWRATYQSALRSTETLLEGDFVSSWDGLTEPVPISMEEGIAQDMGIGVGDHLVFNVQGIEVDTVVSSIREVDWQRMRPNFFTVFPVGVLEDAPNTHIVFTRTRGAEDTALLQQKVVEAFPNITAIDLGLILGTLQTILKQVEYLLRFMGSFSVFIGGVVLAGTIFTGHYQRAKEAVLLRTLGASARQILSMIIVEYTLLGGLAASVGLVLAMGASWGLGKWVLATELNWPVLSLGFGVVCICALTAVIGVLSGYRLATRPPLDVLRED